ncbi:MAG: tRNA (N(6)-L-threonylcarbamoyladenosine(37)-C(2))-methylthiotransferase MtaB, partial [Bacteroidales bacterium]
MKKKDFAIYTLGCKLNFSESSDITRRLTEIGCVLSDKPDFIIVNTCAVTGSAEKKARNFVSKLHRENPESQLIITGCYSALQSEVVKKWEGVSRVFGNRDKLNIINYINGEESNPIPIFFSTYSSHDRTRSFLKIQDGCDYHCTYCTVCIARGESRSDSIENVLKNIEKIHQTGLKEVNLTGVNIGDFGKGREDCLYDLLLSIEKQHLMERVRISSIEPNLLRDEIIDLVAQSEIMMPHF